MFFIQLCVMCAHVCACMHIPQVCMAYVYILLCMHMWVKACVEIRGQYWMSSSITLYLILCNGVPYCTGKSAICLHWLAASSGDLPTSALHSTEVQTCTRISSFYLSAGEPDSSTHACLVGKPTLSQAISWAMCLRIFLFLFPSSPSPSNRSLYLTMLSRIASNLWSSCRKSPNCLHHRHVPPHLAKSILNTQTLYTPLVLCENKLSSNRALILPCACGVYRCACEWTCLRLFMETRSQLCSSLTLHTSSLVHACDLHGCGHQETTLQVWALSF